MTSPAQSVAAIDVRPRVGRRDRLVYLAIALATIGIVALANDAITRFLEERAPGGAVAVLFALPFLVTLTRPLQVTPGHRTLRTERAMAITYAIRARRAGLIFKGIGLGMLWLLLTGGVSLLLYQLALYRPMSAVANWLYVSGTVMLVWNFVPGRFHLQPSMPFTIAVASRDEGAATVFAGLVSLDRSRSDWLTVTGDTGDVVVEQVYGVLAGRTTPGPLQSARMYFTRPRIWSRITGDRAVPVDLVVSLAAKVGPRRRFGVIMLITDDLVRNPVALAKFVERELRRFAHATPSVAVAINEVAPDTAMVVENVMTQADVRDFRLFRVAFDPDTARLAVHASNAAAPVAWLLSRPPFQLRRRKRKA